ncbi:hypothetical protein CCR75_007356 [Bremia lactucae]|uniref:Uncharacterized protein n=1 Tax=Bremia lactucae TaxID=4779 RepID=A0A976FQP3_BRELC|nr:hypothetical protein CCR75_007356 [Bremia lactucae]
METPSVRVLVVGDSGVGKTMLLRSICRFYSPYSVENEKPSTLWTTGCDVHVLLTSLAGSEVFVEFLDVGGHPKYERSRTAFYHNVHGLLLVHDVSNAKSGEHLRTWSHELSCLQKLKGCVVPFNNGKTHDRVPLYELPTLVIGNKTDLGIKQKRVQGLETSEFKTIAYLESSAKPLRLEPSGVFDLFLQQTVAFATRQDRGHLSCYKNPMGLRQTTRGADTDSNQASSIRHNNFRPMASKLPPDKHSRWS